MNLQGIISFLKELEANNNRDWFAENKSLYEKNRAHFESFVEKLIAEIALFDPEIKGVNAKECIFRIYRDTRFASDKTPYKNHFAAYIASRGGRKSLRAGYYLHMQPGESMIAAGVWCPEPPVLKALRQSVYENVDEFAEILSEPGFSTYYKELIGEKLKKVPAGFPKDFEQADWLKPKNYCVDTKLPDTFFDQEECLAEVVRLMKLTQPFNRFLNYTVDEVVFGSV